VKSEEVGYGEKKEIEIRIIARTRVAKTDYCVGGDKGRWPGTAAAAAAAAAVAALARHYILYFHADTPL